MWPKEIPARDFDEPPSPLALRAEPGPAQEERTPQAPHEPGASKEDDKMNASSGPSRILWVLGTFLLLASVIGAGLVHSSLGTSHDPSHGGAAPNPPAVIALGFVCSDPDIVNLYPSQPGRVEWVAPEGAKIQKDEPLLKLDKRLAKLLVQEARVAVVDAEDQLTKANKAPDKDRIDRQLQQDAIDASVYTLSALKTELDLKKELRKITGSPKELEVYEAKIKALEKSVEVERKKLRLLELVDPKLEVTRARNKRDAKKVLLDKAELTLKECELLAPCDGTVLRVFVNPGEPGINPKAPAIQFCPDGKRIIRAEVPQEWAHLVHPTQQVRVEDDTQAGDPSWTGTVRHVSDWFTPRRHPILEPMVFNDVRTLECVIEVPVQDPKLRIGQRVRVLIPQKEKAN